jgi:hypothetical protein
MCPDMRAYTLIQKPFDSHKPSADSMSFKPVELCLTDRPIR